jgi:hypothetical protein
LEKFAEVNFKVSYSIASTAWFINYPYIISLQIIPATKITIGCCVLYLLIWITVESCMRVKENKKATQAW